MSEMTLDSRVPEGPIQDKWTQHKFDMKLVNPANKRKYSVIVVGSGYWPAKKGLEALSPKFTDGGHASVSTPAIYAAQGKLMAAGKPDNEAGDGDAAGERQNFGNGPAASPWGDDVVGLRG